MKKSIKNSISTLLLVAFSFTTLPSYASSEDAGLRICQYVKLNHKARLKSFLRSQHIKVKEIFDSLKCNNKNLLVFAAEQQSVNAGTYLLGRVSSKKVAATFNDIAKFSPQLAKLAKERINKT